MIPKCDVFKTDVNWYDGPLAICQGSEVFNKKL